MIEDDMTRYYFNIVISMIGCILYCSILGSPTVGGLIPFCPTNDTHPNFLYIYSKLALNVLIQYSSDRTTESVECRWR
jgi:hypothetical protein